MQQLCVADQAAAVGGGVIRAVARGRTGEPIVMLGLDPQNMTRLREGQPIKVNLRYLEPGGKPVDELPDLEVVIFFAGKDEVAVLQRLAKSQ